MGRPCSVCPRPDRQAVDAALLGGESYRNICRRSGISLGALSRHRAHAGPVATAPAPERNTVRCATDLELLAALPDESIDVWWSSPPYNLRDPFRGGASTTARRKSLVYAGSRGRGDGTYRPWPEYESWQVRVLTEWHRTLAPGGLAFYSHKPAHDGRRLHHPMEWIARTPLVLIDRLTWDRGGTPNVDTTQLLPTSEEVYLLARRPGVYLHNPQRIKNVIYLPPNHHKRGESGHPCPTHPALVRTCLSLVRRPRDGRRLLVADCYAGIGTTGLAARDLEMDYLLGERSEEYVARTLTNLAGPAPLRLLEAAAG